MGYADLGTHTMRNAFLSLNLFVQIRGQLLLFIGAYILFILCTNGISDSALRQRTHTGEKPFKCKKFDQRFSQRTLLISHQRTHFGEKPFKYENCNKGFVFIVTLVKHQEICNGFNQWFKGFTQEAPCLTHQRTNSGQKLFNCDQCGKIFGNINNVLLSNFREYTVGKSLDTFSQTL